MKKHNGSFKTRFLKCMLCVAFVQSLTLASCYVHECSNDADQSPVLGDEALEWDLPVEWTFRLCDDVPADGDCVPQDERRCYQVATHPDLTIIRNQCESARYINEVGWVYSPPASWFSPYAVKTQFFPRLGTLSSYVVRACLGDNCSDWSPTEMPGGGGPAEFVGVDYICMGSDGAGPCQLPCYPGAGLPLGALRVCEQA